MQPFVGVSPLWLVAIAATSTIGGFAEAGVLALIVQTASTMSRGAGFAGVDIGPFRLSELSVRDLLIAASLVAVLRVTVQLVGVYLPARLSAEVQSSLRRRVIGSFLRAPWAVQADEREGNLIEVTSTQATKATAMMFTVTAGLASACSFAAMVVTSLTVDPAATTLVLVVVIVLFVLLRPLSGLTRRLAKRQATASRSFTAELTSIVATAEETKVFAVEQERLARIEELDEELRVPYFETQLAKAAVPVFYTGLTILLVVGGLAALWATESERIASLGAIVLILVRSLRYGQQMQSSYQSSHELLPFVDVVSETLASYESGGEPAGSRSLDSVTSITFDHVTFAYRTDRPALHDISFSTNGREAIGIVGPSGAGKSTIVQLILGLRTPQQGAILVSGTDLRELAPDEWRKRVAYVPQDTKLVTGSVAENIQFFRSDVTRADVERAAIAAHVHDEVLALPHGYDTVVGQRASAVSGGQRQRICLARALAGSPDILILDEPTSSLDERSEELVTATLLELKQSMTIFVVAHRWRTLDLCDRLLLLRDGRLEAFDDAELVRERVALEREASPSP